MLRFRNDSADVIRERKEISSRFIQFHYCMKGREFYFQQWELYFPVEEEHNILLFNPQQDLPIDLKLEPNSGW